MPIPGTEYVASVDLVETINESDKNLNNPSTPVLSQVLFWGNFFSLSSYMFVDDVSL